MSMQVTIIYRFSAKCLYEYLPTLAEINWGTYMLDEFP